VDDPSGMYRAEIATTGGTIAFLLEVVFIESQLCDEPFVSAYYAIIQNGEEQIRREMSMAFSLGTLRKHEGVIPQKYLQSSFKRVITFDEYDSALVWESRAGFGVTPESQHVLSGVWRKRRGDSYVELPLLMTKLPATDECPQRFLPFTGTELDADVSPERFDGRWRVQFTSSDESAIGVFEIDQNQIATGTFMTTTGDYRFLSGRVDGPYMRLSTFDGAHAFLFHAQMQDDGTIKGEFWSGNWHHETWTAVRDDEAQLPDAFEQTRITDEQALEEAVFKDTEGNPTRVLDALDDTNAKARVIEIFGTWCPNCADASRELVSLKEKYGDDLGVVGLAFEVTEDFERSVQQVRRHHEHIGSDWEVLIAGLSDKDKATKTLGFLDKVRSYPTLVFLNADNEVQAVYSGFSGPATGDAYTAQRERFEQLIDRLIEE
jgi:thiol-disulfide isomerase/thioredoxin